jgi:nanoRNase/pAp phosphatase (c-di-AMP/oligoRNAs hydrolase)
MPNIIDFVGFPDLKIITHGKCADGFLAGLILSERLKCHMIIPMTHSVKFDYSSLKQSNVIMVDIAPATRQEFEAVFGKGRRLRALLIDHHINETTKMWKKLAPHNVILPDENTNSAAALAWMFAYPDKRIPLVVQLVSIRDRYAFHEMEHSFEMSAALNFTMPVTGINATRLNVCLLNNQEQDDAWRQVLISTGKIVVQIRKHFLDTVVLKKSTATIQVNGKKYVVCMANSPKSMASDVGNILVETEPCDFALLYSNDHQAGFVRHELRSSEKKKPEVDLSVLAKLFSDNDGGGGHKNAAGFTRRSPPFVVYDTETGVYQWILNPDDETKLRLAGERPWAKNIGQFSHSLASGFLSKVEPYRYFGPDPRTVPSLESDVLKKEVQDLARLAVPARSRGYYGMIANIPSAFSTLVFQELMFKSNGGAKFFCFYEYFEEQGKTLYITFCINDEVKEALFPGKPKKQPMVMIENGWIQNKTLFTWNL